jgi:hypothetical protein
MFLTPRQQVTGTAANEADINQEQAAFFEHRPDCAFRSIVIPDSRER